MDALFIMLIAGAALLAAYFTYGRWLSARVFNLSDTNTTPATESADGRDYVPSRRSVVFGHHFTSIAGTGPIVGPAIAVLWGWLPALLWVVLGSIFIGAVHDLGSLVISLRHRGRTIGDIAGDILGPRARLLFFVILVVALWIVLAVFGLVIAGVLRQYPEAILPVAIQIPLALLVGFAVRARTFGLVLPSIASLAIMLGSVVLSVHAMAGGSLLGLSLQPLADLNTALAGFSTATWVLVLLAYAGVASMLPVWTLLQPRDYINALQLILSLGVLVVGVIVAGLFGGRPADPAFTAGSGSERVDLSIMAPTVDWQPLGAPPLFPVLFITVACGAVSGFHCLVASGTTSKQISKETHARSIGFGGMLTEGFLATLVIIACVAGIGLGTTLEPQAGRRPTTIRLIDVEADNPQIDSPRYQGYFTTYSLDIGGERRFVGVLEPETVETPGSDVFVDVEDTTPIIRHWRYRDNFNIEVEIGEAELIETIRADRASVDLGASRLLVRSDTQGAVLTGPSAYTERYSSWQNAGSLRAKVSAFVDGAGNLLAAIGIPRAIGAAFMAVFVASFAATTMDTTARLQRYVLQELGMTLLPRLEPHICPSCGYDCSGLEPDDETDTQRCPECGTRFSGGEKPTSIAPLVANGRAKVRWYNPGPVLITPHGATIAAVSAAALLALVPSNLDFLMWTWQSAGTGGLVLWPIFGATNQLLAGFAFIVIVAWLIMTGRRWLFAVLPGIVMLILPALAMGWQAFIGNAINPSWWSRGEYLLVAVAIGTLVIEAWLLIEAARRWPTLRARRYEHDTH